MMSTQGQASELYLTIRQLNGLLILVTFIAGDCKKDYGCSDTCIIGLSAGIPAFVALVSMILCVLIINGKLRFPRCCNQQTGEDARTKSSTPDDPVQTCGRGPTKNLPTPTSRS
ncbi:uncharacterized protein LOC112568370 isoform X2 [Pomacea canaliculata]|uniref:uncharacterized protein LOC112568370 isoform X2 n=1 Tax=Pomacea canaliculata TaxID=400727 RepID=UPI000D72D8A5|nr:uncharacterized protein LOC112568370 isoform X2 [Pomacea canaliculata]